MSEKDLLKQLEALLDPSDEAVTNLANASALLFYAQKDLNWAGFYLLKGDALYLGPFQGKPACTRIPVGKGVCGTAVAKNKTQRVGSVHAFPGHIACDCASESELVVVLRAGDGMPIGVLDLDSPKKERFSEQDASLMEQAAALIARAVEEKLR
ncbi:MAG TPA: GAF domain-containing protein [Eubacteriales bacterium]|nr:GAF domain-containing protein [Eubacteriales bacterium]